MKPDEFVNGTFEFREIIKLIAIRQYLFFKMHLYADKIDKVGVQRDNKRVNFLLLLLLDTFYR